MNSPTNNRSDRMAALFGASPQDCARVAGELAAACRAHGFFYLTGTGVTPELEARLHRTARAFFELPVFQPPKLDASGESGVPHLGLDDALFYLIGDRL